jgi:4-amino-4-deoxy-L-arabinose transferase-like glycosyltransferase
MSQLAKYQLWIVLAAGVIFFTNLGATALFDMDEALYATCAREMLDRGNAVVPWFNGAMFPEKPPLMFWTMMGGFKLFGVSEFGARFFSAVMGVGTALVAFHLGRILFNLRVALWAGLITASTIVFTISARAATVDSALTFFTSLAFLMFVAGWKRGTATVAPQSPNLQISKSSNPNPQSPIPNPFPLPYAVAAYACIGVAVLGKGPVGMLLPLAAMGLFLLTINGWRKLFACAWWMRPFTAIVVIAVVAVPWYIEVGRETQWEWPKQFFLNFNLRPFRTPIQGHGDTSSLTRLWAGVVSILYYLFQIPAVLIGFFPWSVFLGPTAIDAIRRLREGRDASGENAEAVRSRQGVLLALCWFGVWFVFWSVCKTKLFHYLLPAYPALALLTACFVDNWLASEKGSELLSAQRPRNVATKSVLTPFPAWALRNAWLSTILVGMAIVIVLAFAIPLKAPNVLPGEASLGLLGLLLVGGGAWSWRKTVHGRCRDAAVTFAFTCVVFLTAVFGFAALRVDPFQNAKPMMAAICADENHATKQAATEKATDVIAKRPRGEALKSCLPPSPQSPIATYCFFRESTVFYGGKPVTRCDENGPRGGPVPQSLSRFFAENPGRSYVITTDEHKAELEKAFPGRLQLIHQEPRFLADGEMVIFRHD